MPFVLTTMGRFGPSLPPDVIEWVISQQLTRRLIDCSDDAVMRNPARVQALELLRINVRGRFTGVVANPLRDLGTRYGTLRCDKLENRWLEANGVIKRYASLQVRLEEQAHGGILCPYDEGFSFTELGAALRESMRNVPERGYAVMYRGPLPPALREV